MGNAQRQCAVRTQVPNEAILNIAGMCESFLLRTSDVARKNGRKEKGGNPEEEKEKESHRACREMRGWWEQHGGLCMHEKEKTQRLIICDGGGS